MRSNNSTERLMPSVVTYGSVCEIAMMRFALLVLISSDSALPLPNRFCCDRPAVITTPSVLE